jgi:hypothetical protein
MYITLTVTFPLPADNNQQACVSIAQNDLTFGQTNREGGISLKK